MVLDVSGALKAPGTSFRFSLEQQYAPMNAGGEQISFRSPVEVNGTYVYSGEDFLLEGRIRVAYQALCCRCLKEVDAGLSIAFDEEFARTADEEHPDRYLFRGEQLELDTMVTELISLNIPMRHLCNEGCRGLCPVCGADRNTTDCCHGTDPEGGAPYAAF